MTVEAYEEALENRSGYCSTCDEITFEDAETDDTGLECPECENLTGMGVEVALELDHIVLKDEDYEDEDEEEYESDYYD
jgi:hypothetical protein